MAKFITSIQVAVLILLVSCPYDSIQQERQIDPEVQKKIEDYIQNVYLPSSGSSEIGLAIVGNGLVFTEGYGMANREKGIPNSNDTQFLIGSATKSFTSLVLTKLLHERFPELGEAVLDTPVIQLLPEFNFTLSDRFRSEHFTTRNLLAHRLCLFPDDLHLITDPFSTTDELVYRTRYIQESCSVRSKFEYNNQMYVVAGKIISILAGKPYEEAVEDFLGELGMNNSRFSRRDDDYENGLENRARPYQIVFGEVNTGNTKLVKRVTSHNPAGGLFVPPNDMVRYMRFQLNNGNLDGRQIVPQNVMEWTFKPSMLTAATSSKENEDEIILNYSFAYGLGWHLGSLDGYKMNHHGGHFPPFISQISLFPAKNIAVFTSTNVEPVKVSPVSLHSYIFMTLIGKNNSEAVEKAEKIKNEMESQKVIRNDLNLQELASRMKNNKNLKQIENIVGNFGSGSAGNVEISEGFNEEWNETVYFIDYKDSAWYKGWLYPLLWDDDDKLYLFNVNFVTDLVEDAYAKGEGVSMDYIIYRGGDSIEFLQMTMRNWNVTYYLDLGTFQRNVGLDTLPEIPWAPGSCGVET